MRKVGHLAKLLGIKPMAFVINAVKTKVPVYYEYFEHDEGTMREIPPEELKKLQRTSKAVIVIHPAISSKDGVPEIDRELPLINRGVEISELFIEADLRFLPGSFERVFHSKDFRKILFKGKIYEIQSPTQRECLNILKKEFQGISVNKENFTRGMAGPFHDSKRKPEIFLAKNLIGKFLRPLRKRQRKGEEINPFLELSHEVFSIIDSHISLERKPFQ